VPVLIEKRFGLLRYDPEDIREVLDSDGAEVFIVRREVFPGAHVARSARPAHYVSADRISVVVLVNPVARGRVKHPKALAALNVLVTTEL